MERMRREQAKYIGLEQAKYIGREQAKYIGLEQAIGHIGREQAKYIGREQATKRIIVVAIKGDERLVFRLLGTQLSPRSDQRVRTRCTYLGTLGARTRSSTLRRSNQSRRAHVGFEPPGGPPRTP
jgi:hypothetical protein